MLKYRCASIIIRTHETDQNIKTCEIALYESEEDMIQEELTELERGSPALVSERTP